MEAEFSATSLSPLLKQTLAQSEACQAVVLAHSTEVEALVGPVLLGAISTMRGLVATLSLGQVRNSLILSRALIEACVTASYLRCADGEVHKKYVQFALARQHRSSMQEVVLADFQLKIGKMPPHQITEDLQSSLDAFTGVKGRTITRWTNKSLLKQLLVVEESGLIDIRPHTFAMLAIYEDASDATHGTLYGAINHFGYYDGLSNPGAVARNLLVTSVNIASISSRTLTATVKGMGDFGTVRAIHERIVKRDEEIVAEVERLLNTS